MIRFLSVVSLAALFVPVVFAEEIALERMSAEAARLDELIDAVLREDEKAAPPSVDDATFLRRASLVAIGRIPTLAEIQEFAQDTSAEKRSRLVARLYQSKGYESHMNNWFCDHLRLNEVKLQGGYFSSNTPLINWTRQSVRENKSWKAMTVELLSSRGNG